MGINQCNENTFTKDLAPAKNGFQFNRSLDFSMEHRNWQYQLYAKRGQKPFFHYSGVLTFPPGRRPNTPACKPYGLEAEPEANWSEAPNWIKHVP